MENKISRQELKRIFEEELGVSWDTLKQIVKKYEKITKDENKGKNRVFSGRDKVLRAMKVSGTFTPVDLAKLAGINYKLTITYVCEFVKKGFVVKIGRKGRRRYYKFIKDVENVN